MMGLARQKPYLAWGECSREHCKLIYLAGEEARGCEVEVLRGGWIHERIKIEEALLLACCLVHVRLSSRILQHGCSCVRGDTL